MSKSIEQQAVETLYSCFTWAQGAEALSRAGLLVSERDVLCRAVCEVLRTKGITAKEFDDAYHALAAYDREHAPKPRYYAEGVSVFDRQKPSSERPCHEWSVANCDTPERAVWMAAALNALDEKEAGR